MASLSFPAPRLSRGPVVLHPDCGRKVRLGADGWGYCRGCRQEFDGADAWEVPDVT